MEKAIRIIFLEPAQEFMEKLDKQTTKKFLFAFDKTRMRIFGKWFKKLTSTDIFEFKVDDGVFFYRLFAFWDSRRANETLIVCTHGFEKKSDKTPSKEIDRAEKIRREYFEDTS